jgi:hypothetical protein
MQNDICVEGENPCEYTPRLCIPLGTTLELSSASPWERLWSFVTFDLGGI